MMMRAGGMHGSKCSSSDFEVHRLELDTIT